MSGTGEPTGSAPQGEGRLWNVARTVLLVALVAVTLLLVKQNRDLKATLASLHAAGSANVPRLEAGDVVEPFTLPALDGTTTRLDFAGRNSETLLLCFSPDCPACKRNFANWQEIDQSEQSGNRRVVFISTVAEDKTRPYLADKNLRSEVLLGDPDVLDRFKVFRIPTTVQVGADGVVRGVWTGLLPDTVVRELQAPV